MFIVTEYAALMLRLIRIETTQRPVHYTKLVFLFLNQNLCCGYSKEPSQ